MFNTCFSLLVLSHKKRVTFWRNKTVLKFLSVETFPSFLSYGAVLTFELMRKDHPELAFKFLLETSCF